MKSKTRTIKKMLAGILAAAVVAGGIPANTGIGGLFGGTGTSITAKAADAPSVKTFTVPDSWANDSIAYTANDLPNDFKSCTDEEAAAWAASCNDQEAILIYSTDNVYLKTSKQITKYSYLRQELYGAKNSGMPIYYTVASASLDGSGTESDPYKINSAADLLTYATGAEYGNENDKNYYIEFRNDITYTGDFEIRKSAIILLGDNTFSAKSITVNNGIMVGVANGTIKGDITNNAILQVSSSTVSDAITNNGTLIVDSGTVSGAITNNGNINILGGTVLGNITNTASAQIHISGGTVSGDITNNGDEFSYIGVSKNEYSDNGAPIVNGTITNNNNGLVKISYGTFAHDPRTITDVSIDSEKYRVKEVTENGTTVYQVVDAENEVDHTHDGIRFTAWNDSNSLPDKEGSYYLTTDVTLNANSQGRWIVTGVTNLCLNGHVITMEPNGDYTTDVVVVETGNTLNLYDKEDNSGIITHSGDAKGSGIDVKGGTFNMYGGTISGNKGDRTTGYGGGVYVYDGGSFTMYGGIIKDNTGSNGGGVYVEGSSSFTLKDGSITGNKASSFGGGLHAKGGTVIVNGGNISSNNAVGNGGGIYVGYESTLTMTSGSVTENSGSNGAGMYMNNSTVSISGGSISSNTCTTWGAGIYVDKATLTFGSEVSISNNTANYLGGGMYIDGSEVRVPSGVTITGNTARNGGGVYVPAGSGFTLAGGEISANNAINTDGGGIYGKGATALVRIESGTITGNTAKEDGGGMFVSNAEMSGGEISNNTANAYGGGIAIASNGSFTHNGGTISDNKAVKYGGGIFGYQSTINVNGGEIVSNEAVRAGGIFANAASVVNLSGGNISNNKGTEYYGGVYLAKNAAINVSGSPVVTSNKQGNSESNVYLSTDKKITVTGTLQDNAAIGVTTADVPSETTPTVVFTSGLSGQGDVVGFTSDNTEYVVSASNSNEAQLVRMFTSTATGYSGSYDGEAHGITVNVTNPADGAVIKYGTEEGNYEQTESPAYTDAGTYTVYYQITADGYVTKTGSAAVIIDKAVIDSVTAPAVRTLTYNGQAQALVTAGTVLGGTMQYKLGENGTYSENIPTATNAGNYTVYYKVLGDANHKDSDEGRVNVTIAKANVSINAPTANELTYNGQAQALVTAGTVAGGTMQYKLGENGTYGETIPKATNAGDYTVYYKAVGDNDHQDSDEGNLTVVINKATPAAPIVNSTNETVKNKNDGTITSVDSAMEYKKQGDENYTAISDDKLENLSAGTYLVRYKADDNHNASSDTTVVIGEGAAITVSFETNGGSEVDEITGLSYNDKITEPAEPTLDKFYFAGWYKDKDCTELWIFNNDTVKEKDITLYAKWSAIPAHTVKGIVYENDAVTPKSNVKVSLVKGNEIIGITTTDDKGEFNIIALEDTYNIIATDEENDITKTELVELKADTEIKVVMPNGQKESILDNTDAGDFEAIVGGLDAIAEKETVQAGEKVTLKLAIRDDDAASSAADNTEYEAAKTAISESTEAKGKTLDYFDLTLTKTVTDTINDTVKSTEKYTITDKSLITVKLTTYNSAGKTNISLIRYTDSDIEEITTTPNENGEYIEVENDGSLTIHVAEIAPYAVSYTTPTKRSGGGGSSSTYAITSETAENGKIKTSVSSAVKGKEVKITATPNEGYELDTVTVTDKNGKTVEVTKNEDGTYSFTMPASKVTVTPVFKEASAEPTTSPAPTAEPQATEKPSGDMDKWFVDVPESTWYYAPIKEAFDAERMSGMSEDYFEPETDITRGMFAYAIYRREGLPATDAQNKFEDVKAGSYYETAIAWATENGIVAGYDDTHYGPDDQITREQMAAILYRYAQFKAYDVSVGEDTNILDFTDAFDISEYAIPAIQWAVGDSVISGFEDGTMRPKANANRAQMAVILNKIADMF